MSQRLAVRFSDTTPTPQIRRAANGAQLCRRIERLAAAAAALRSNRDCLNNPRAISKRTRASCAPSVQPVFCNSKVSRLQHLAWEVIMPEKQTLERAQRDKREGKAPSTQAGEFVREEMDHIREGKHGARSTKQAIAIGLSKARRAGVDLPAPKAGSSDKVKAQAKRDSAKGRSHSDETPSETRSRATLKA